MVWVVVFGGLWCGHVYVRVNGCCMVSDIVWVFGWWVYMRCVHVNLVCVWVVWENDW